MGENGREGDYMADVVHAATRLVQAGAYDPDFVMSNWGVVSRGSDWEDAPAV